MRHRLLRALTAMASLLVLGSAARAAATAPLAALEHARWVAEGSAHPKHVLYVFMDANCPYCRTLWRDLAPLYGERLQVRELLVGVISASSPAKAAAILESPDPAAALRLNEERWNHGPVRGGGIAPLAHPSAQVLNDIRRNEQLMVTFGIQGTPGVVFANAQGRLYVIPGLPRRRELAPIVQLAASPAAIAPAPHPHAP